MLYITPGSAVALRALPGFEDDDESKHCEKRLKPGSGAKDVPRASSLKLEQTTQSIGLTSTSYDPESEMADGLLAAKHVDDISMAGLDGSINDYVEKVEAVFGECKLN